MRGWLALALVSAALAPGCFASHGLGIGGEDPPRDAGPAPATDAGGAACGAIASAVGALSCPATVAPGEPIFADVTHAPSWCCEPGGGRARVEPRGDRAFEVVTWWDACACCAECECVGAPRTERLALGAFERGVVRVVAGGERCAIEVRERECRTIDADEVHAPMAVARGEAIPVLLRRSVGAGCGCTPRGSEHFGREGGQYAALDACDCSDEDPCVDAGYEATAIMTAFEGTDAQTIETSAGAVQVAIVDPDRCTPGPDVRALRIEAPSESRIGERPAGWWAVLELEQSYCCAAPVSRVEVARAGELIELRPRSCVDSDCDCVPHTPSHWEHWHFLGFLPAGRHVVRAGDRELALDVH